MKLQVKKKSTSGKMSTYNIFKLILNLTVLLFKEIMHSVKKNESGS